MQDRIQFYSTERSNSGPYVLYWMQANVRLRHNLALEWAAEEARSRGLELQVLFCLDHLYPEANERSFAFLLDGLRDVAKELERNRIPFTVALSSPVAAVKACAQSAALTVFDRAYLPFLRIWRTEIAKSIPCPIVMVEDNVLVPIQTVSNKDEWAAATLRPKLMRMASLYVVPSRTNERLEKIKTPNEAFERLPSLLNEKRIQTLDVRTGRTQLPRLQVDTSVPATETEGGEIRAWDLWTNFCQNKLERYKDARNDPNQDGQSGLAPYLHFGHISPILVAEDLMKQGLWKEPLTFKKAGEDSVSQFLDEFLVRRELSMNFVYFNAAHSSVEGLPGWARATLQKHRNDPRTWIYDRSEWESAKTHDTAWNAAQNQMVRTGIMHGYMRMYWGKKLLEWSRSPEEAYETAIYLNNKYALDGRDPNSYAGIAWCFGKHDRPWGERPVYGVVRSMVESGLRRKFDLDAYVRRFTPLPRTF